MIPEEKVESPIVDTVDVAELRPEIILPRKKHGVLVGLLIGAAVLCFSCLLLVTLLFTASGGKPRTANQKSKGTAKPEMVREIPKIAPNKPPERENYLTNSMDMTMAYIPAGDFIMDQTKLDPLQYVVSGWREVNIAWPFYMAIHEVTQKQFVALMNSNPSHVFIAAGDVGWDWPVERVTWDEANTFCDKLSALPAEKRAGRVYRLPTEAEWEYACRAGSKTPYYFDPRRADEYAWTRANSGGKLHGVGQLKPNDWGLYDMIGNVYEWCLDKQDGRWHEASQGWGRVLRGGAFTEDVGQLRRWYDPTKRVYSVGFRVVCVQWALSKAEQWDKKWREREQGFAMNDDEPKSLPLLNSKVLQFAEDNLGKQVADGECAMLVLKAYEAAGARQPTPEEVQARVWGRRLKPDENPLPGDIVEFEDVRFETKDGGGSFETLFHTTILLKVKDGKFVVLQQNGPDGKMVHELDLSAYEKKKGELIVFRSVPEGTRLPDVVLPASKGSWEEKSAHGQKVRYLSDMNEFDVKVAEGRFSRNGNLGFGAGRSFRIRVQEKESPHGLSMVPPSNAHSSVKYRLDKSAETLVAWAALNDSSGAPGRPPGDGKIPTPVTLQVLGDGNLLWESEPVDIARKVQECKVDVTNVNVLELRVSCPGLGVNAHPVWLEPRVVLR